MRLNIDCIRDILLTADEVLSSQNDMSCYPPIKYDRLKKYTFKEINFHIMQCSMSNLVVVQRYVDGGISIRNITPQGYEFIDKISSNTAWKKIKNTLKPIGSASLKTVIEVALTVLLS